MPTFDLVTSAVEMLAAPLAKLWSIVLPGNNASHTDKQPHNEILPTWSAMTTALQVGGVTPLPASLLSSLTPLLVTTLTAQHNKLASVTLNFWAQTFDRQEGLSYAAELVNAFSTYSKTNRIPHELRLVGMGVVRRDGVSEERDTSVSDSDVTAVNETQSDDMSELRSESGSMVQYGTEPDEGEVIVIPHSSPMRGSRSPCRKSGFIGRTSPRRLLPSPRKTYPISPNARALEKVLSRSPYRSDRSATTATSGAKLESVCKKLSLNREHPQIVSPTYSDSVCVRVFGRRGYNRDALYRQYR